MADYDDDEFPDDDEFDEYNPHPYSGGYDIFATYGAPRPPSSATCYPVSTRAAVTAPTAPQPSLSSIPPSAAPAPPRSAPAPAPASPPRSAPAPAPASPAAKPRPSSPPPPPAEPYYWPEPYNWGDAPRDQPMYTTPEVFRRWPFFSGPQRHSACCCRDYWRQCMRGLDYLFGHTDGYGERRIGVDCTGVPVYANRKGGVEDAVVVEVPHPTTETVEWHYAGEETQHQSNVRKLAPHLILLNFQL